MSEGLIGKKTKLFQDNWIERQEPGVRLGRVQNYKKWSPHKKPDQNKTCRGLEYFCFEGDDLWNMADEDLVELGKREMETLGLVKSSEVEDGCVVRMPKAYPAYDSKYQSMLDMIRCFLKGITNLQLVGRNGMHRYNNQDHSMLTAMLAVENIFGAEHDLWIVNDDLEYHEEKQLR